MSCTPAHLHAWFRWWQCIPQSPGISLKHEWLMLVMYTSMLELYMYIHMWKKEGKKYDLKNIKKLTKWKLPLKNNYCMVWHTWKCRQWFAHTSSREGWNWRRMHTNENNCAISKHRKQGTYARAHSFPHIIFFKVAYISTRIWETLIHINKVTLLLISPNNSIRKVGKRLKMRDKDGE